MPSHDLEKPLEDLTAEELLEALEEGDVTIQELMQNDEVRDLLRELVVKQDMEEHRDIYDRLAEV